MTCGQNIPAAYIYCDGTTALPKCVACTVCQPGTYLSTACGIANDAVCTPCVSPAASYGTNAASCSCIKGYYKLNGVCTACSSQAMSGLWPSPTCPSLNEYMSCDGQNPPTCAFCTGFGTMGKPMCAAGNEPSFDCGKQPASNTNNTVCQGCQPGFEKPTGLTRFCTACITAYFASSSGTVNCLACTNKPPNSVYGAWATTASTSACPWVCDKGFYLGAGGACVACPAGTYKPLQNNVSYCANCTNAPANAYYVLSLANGGSAACPWWVL